MQNINNERESKLYYLYIIYIYKKIIIYIYILKLYIIIFYNITNIKQTY